MNISEVMVFKLSSINLAAECLYRKVDPLNQRPFIKKKRLNIFRIWINMLLSMLVTFMSFLFTL